ncbi:MAG TPA: hypothetical protein EYP10_06715, partial [Armatimonadetes bacterium]|nr:hypothetical protein [Armatimonadota bacterium]
MGCMRGCGAYHLNPSIHTTALRSGKGCYKLMLRLCRIEHIDAAHYLPQHPKCGQVHGHTYRIEVIIANEDDRDMLMDLDELKERIWQVLKRYDHKLLNDVMDCVPTVE